MLGRSMIRTEVEKEVSVHRMVHRWRISRLFFFLPLKYSCGMVCAIQGGIKLCP